MTFTRPAPSGRLMLNKVPEITIYFWIIKVLCTTVGETAADFLNVSLNLGLTGTSVVTGVLLVVALALQFSTNRYAPSRYWLAVTLVSVFGTLVTDNLTTNLGLPLEASTVIFGVLLAVTFLAWYRSELTLSIHSIFTSRRESFYWLAILFTFALGTATGDLMAEALGLGYAVTGIIVASVIAITAVGGRVGLNSGLAFWIIYILTRPLGASTGDYLSQPSTHGGLGLGTTITSLIFVGAIIAVVIYLSVTKADVISGPPTDRTAAPDAPAERGGLLQTVVVVSVLLVAGGAGYYLQKSALAADSSDSSAAARPNPDGSQSTSGSPLGDPSTFSPTSQDPVNLLMAGDQAGATARIGDLEYEWDNAQARLKPKDDAAWTEVDGRIDTVLRELRAANPNTGQEQSALTALLAALG